MSEFVAFPKMARLSRDIIITEKLDGTNASVWIEDGEIRAGSRTRFITPQDDNFGFAKWVEDNKESLLYLGNGTHFGEWWGKGIQRGYGLSERRFSLFNAQRWCESSPEVWKTDPRTGDITYQELVPDCCRVVPVLHKGAFDTNEIDRVLRELSDNGSHACNFRNPEGIVIYHTAGNIGFKKTLEHDNGKGQLK